MHSVKLNITLELRGPSLTRASEPMNWGADAAWPRTVDNKAVLPRTLVHGVLKESLLELVEASGESFVPPLKPDDIHDLMGWNSEPKENRDGPLSQRSRLYLSDFIGPQITSNQKSNRVAIDSRSGAARRHHLFAAESPFLPGSISRFTGTVQFDTTSEQEATQLITAVTRGFQWLTQVGAMKSVGFGELASVNVLVNHVDATAEEDNFPDITDDGRLHLSLKFQQAFCLSMPRVVGNLYESTDIVPGAAIKGAVAERWRTLRKLSPGVAATKTPDPDRPELSIWFDQIRFSHAFPSPADSAKRPTVPPISLAQTPWRPEGQAGTSKSWADLSLLPQPCLVGDRAPKYRFDWKAAEIRKVDEEAFGWAFPSRTLQMRNEMDPNLRTTRDGNLFALELVRPNDVEWMGWIDFSAIPNTEVRFKAARQLWGLLTPEIRGIGKTKARATVKQLPGGDRNRYPSDVTPNEGLWVIVLQTPTLLADPARLPDWNDPHSTFKEYSRIWDELSGGSLRLSHFLARQSLAGGDYLWRQFQKARPYQPWLLTTSGSVFVLRSAGDVLPAQQQLLSWLQLGIPLPKWVSETFGLIGEPSAFWKNCPFVPQNGYGEISVNALADCGLTPPRDIVTYIHFSDYEHV